jgi:hypothetical protein
MAIPRGIPKILNHSKRLFTLHAELAKFKTLQQLVANDMAIPIGFPEILNHSRRLFTLQKLLMTLFLGYGGWEGVPRPPQEQVLVMLLKLGNRSQF